MNYRELGTTGLEVSEVGYGAWGIAGDAWLGAEDEISGGLEQGRRPRPQLHRHSPGLRRGHSERLVGKILAERDETIHVATKIPPKNQTWPAPDGIPPEEAFPGDHVRECTEQSLQNLGLETIDVQQFHVWQDDWVGSGDWLEAVEDLKKEGKVRAFGVSINDHQPENTLRLIETGAVDTVQVIYNLFEQSPEDELFPACREHGVGVIVRVPFDEGDLTGRITSDTTFEEGDFRTYYFRGDRKREVHERVRAIVSELGASEDEIAEIVLRYILSHPAVSTVIPGMRSVRNVERNMAAGDGQGLPEDQVQKPHSHRWDRNFYA